MFEKLNWRSEEGIINIIVLASWIFIMPIIIVLEFREFAIWALAMFALVLLGMLGSILYFRKSSALKGLKRDERTEKYALKSVRNGFLMTIILTGFLTVLTFVRGSHIDALFLLIWIWSWAAASYQLSYLYYVMRG
jgi:hypothetical protein